MNRPFSRILPVLKRRFFTSCDGNDEQPDLMEQANILAEGEKERIKTPMQYENLRNYLNQGSIGTYDGLRFIVQKQVNLNTVVSHFYWIGSQVTQQPIYQYRLILPFDEKVVNVATDMDFNVEGEVKFPVSDNVHAKANFTIGDQQTTFSADLDVTDDNSASQLQYSHGDGTVALSHMQSITPGIVLGGSGVYSLKSRSLAMAYGGMVTRGQHTLAAQWDNQMKFLYLNKVNPNRVHLTTDLSIDQNGGTQASVSAEFTLKQSKVHMGVDSNLSVKSVVDTTVTPGVSLQFSAEQHQPSGSYKYGFGIIMG